MRVLQFIPSLNAYDGGTTTYMQQLAPFLGARVELHVCVLTPLEDCVSVPGATLHRIELRLTHLLRMRRQWMELLDQLQPDVLHVNCCWLPQCALVQRWTRSWSQRNHRKVPCFLTPHGMLEPWLISRNYWTRKVPAIWLYQRWAVRDADGIIATALSERQHLSQLGWCNPERICLLPNGIDVHSIRVKENWNEQHMSLLFMSRLHPKKGLDMLLEAMTGVEGFDLVIAGDGDPSYIEELKHLAQSLHLSERCRFVGPVYGSDKWDLIRSAEGVVLPSHSENFGLIVAEALASGVPVLTTQGTPWKEIQEYRCGWWVEPTAPAIRSALEALAKTSLQERKEMGQRGRKLVLEHFDISALVEGLLSVYWRK